MKDLKSPKDFLRLMKCTIESWVLGLFQQHTEMTPGCVIYGHELELASTLGGCCAWI